MQIGNLMNDGGAKTGDFFMYGGVDTVLITPHRVASSNVREKGDTRQRSRGGWDT